MGHIVNHAQCHRLDARATQTAGTDAQQRLALLDIHRHTHQCVDERNRVGTLSLYRTGDVGNAGYVRRKLHDQGLVIHLAHRLYHTCSTLAGNAESHTSILYVRAGNIQLDGRNLIQLIHTCRTLRIALRRVSAHVYDHIGIDVLNLRIDVLAEVLHTLVLKSHTVEHSLWSFSHAWIVISLAWFQGSTLYDDTSDFLQRNEISKLQSVAESSRCSHHWILQLQILYIYT